MSRIGSNPITIPEGVNTKLENGVFTCNAKANTLSVTIDPLISLKIDGNTIIVDRKNNSIKAKSLHGTTRKLILNSVNGVVKPFEKKLEVKGVGYRVGLSGNDLELNVGFSHPVKISTPEGIKFEVKKNFITISGADKQKVGQIAAQIREIRPPEPYKGKGIKYTDEEIRRKAGKAAKAAGEGK